MITHRERIQACLRGQIVDRPAVALWRHFPVDDQSPDTLAAAHLAFQHAYDFDLVKVTPASSFSVKDWGVQDRWEGSLEGTRTYTHRVIRKPQDWENLPALLPAAPHLAQQLQCLRLLRATLGVDTPLLQTVFNPLAQAKHLAGDDLLRKHLREHPEAVEFGLGAIAQTTQHFIREAAEAGIDGIFYAIQHAQPSMLSQQEFARFSRNLDLMLLQAADGLWCNILHVHGEDVYLNAVSSYPAHILNWHDREAGPSLEHATRIWPGVLCAGLSRQTLVYGSPPAIAQQAAEAFSRSSRPPILSTGCVLPIIAPHGNIVAARNAAAAAGSSTFKTRK